MREAELHEVKKQIDQIESIDAQNAIAKTVDPTGELAKNLDLGGVETSLQESARALTREPAASPALAAPAEPAALPPAKPMTNPGGTG